MPHLKSRVRRILAFLLYYSGLLWVLAGFKLHGRATVLMYHRVLPPGGDSFSHSGIVVSPATFATHLKFLSRHFRMMTVEQFSLELRRPAFSRRACLVTFDDGWHDTVQFALPLLIQHKVPAIVFVATDFVGTDRTFWQERLTRLLFAATRSKGTGHDILQLLGILHACDLNDQDARRVVRDSVTLLKSRELATVEQLLAALESTVGRDMPNSLTTGEDRFLSWGEVRALAESKVVTIGSHAHTHTPLPVIGYADAKREFTRSRQELEDQGIHDVLACAYPHGDVDEAVVQAARDSGFGLGFATTHGHVRNGDDPFRLSRINVHESSSITRAEFLSLILGVL